MTDNKILDEEITDDNINKLKEWQIRLIDKVGIDNIISFHNLSNGEIYTKPFLVDKIKNLSNRKSKIIYTCMKCNKKVDYSRIDMAIMNLGKCCKPIIKKKSIKIGEIHW